MSGPDIGADVADFESGFDEAVLVHGFLGRVFVLGADLGLRVLAHHVHCLVIRFLILLFLLLVFRAQTKLNQIFLALVISLIFQFGAG